jgi:hypothetical protein
MIANQVSEVGRLIKAYIEHREKFLLYHKKKNDAEKEYNKLLVNAGGEDKNFSLEQADKIYKAYLDMQTNDAQSRIAQDLFNETEDKLKEVGRILFHATISAEIPLSPVNGGIYDSKLVTVTFPNGEVLVA